VLAAAVGVVSAPELVGVHARGGGKRFCALLRDAVRYVDEGGGSGRGRWGTGRRSLGLL
jgi:hypothetical protein